MSDTATIIFSACIGTGLILLTLGWCVYCAGISREERKVSVATVPLSGNPSVTVTGYDPKDVPLLVLDTTAYYLAAPEKAKVWSSITLDNSESDREVALRDPDYEQPHRVPGTPRPRLVKNKPPDPTPHEEYRTRRPDGE